MIKYDDTTPGVLRRITNRWLLFWMDCLQCTRLHWVSLYRYHHNPFPVLFFPDSHWLGPLIDNLTRYWYSWLGSLQYYDVKCLIKHHKYFQTEWPGNYHGLGLHNLQKCLQPKPGQDCGSQLWTRLPSAVPGWLRRLLSKLQSVFWSSTANPIRYGTSTGQEWGPVGENPSDGRLEVAEEHDCPVRSPWLGFETMIICVIYLQSTGGSDKRLEGTARIHIEGAHHSPGTIGVSRRSVRKQKIPLFDFGLWFIFRDCEGALTRGMQ